MPDKSTTQRIASLSRREVMTQRPPIAAVVATLELFIKDDGASGEDIILLETGDALLLE